MNTASAYPVTYDISVQSGTASAPTDYVDYGVQTQTISPGTYVHGGYPHTIRSDSINEETETFTVKLSNPVGATIGDDAATVTISDNDSPSNTDNSVAPSGTTELKVKPSKSVTTKLRDDLTKSSTDSSDTVKKLKVKKHPSQYLPAQLCQSDPEPTNFVNYHKNSLYHVRMGENFTIPNPQPSEYENFGSILDLNKNYVYTTSPSEQTSPKNIYALNLESKTLNTIMIDEIITPQISSISSNDDILAIGLPTVPASADGTTLPIPITSSASNPGSGIVLLYDISSESLHSVVRPLVGSSSHTNFGDVVKIYENKLLVTDDHGAYVYNIVDDEVQFAHSLVYPVQKESVIDVDMTDKYIVLRTANMTSGTAEMVEREGYDGRTVYTYNTDPQGNVVMIYQYIQDFLHVFNTTDGSLIRTIHVNNAFSDSREEFFNPYHKTIKIHNDLIVVGYPTNDGARGSCDNCMNNGVVGLIDLKSGQSINAFHNPEPFRDDRFGITVDFDGVNVIVGDVLSNHYIFDKKSYMSHYKKFTTPHRIISAKPLLLHDLYVVIGDGPAKSGTIKPGVIRLIKTTFQDANNNGVYDKDEYLSSPTMTYPENNSVISGQNLKFRWTYQIEFKNEIYYTHVQVFERSNDQNHILKYDMYVPYSDNARLCTLENGKQYDWRVRAIDFDGNKGEFSSFNTFETNP